MRSKFVIAAIAAAALCWGAGKRIYQFPHSKTWSGYLLQDADGDSTRAVSKSVVESTLVNDGFLSGVSVSDTAASLRGSIADTSAALRASLADSTGAARASAASALVDTASALRIAISGASGLVDTAASLRKSLTDTSSALRVSIADSTGAARASAATALTDTAVALRAAIGGGGGGGDTAALRDSMRAVRSYVNRDTAHARAYLGDGINCVKCIAIGDSIATHHYRTDTALDGYAVSRVIAIGKGVLDSAFYNDAYYTSPSNIAIGDSAARKAALDGYAGNSIFVGNHSGAEANTTGGQFTCIGDHTCYRIPYDAGATCVGHNAGQSDGWWGPGEESVAIGGFAGAGKVSGGSRDVDIGFQAGMGSGQTNEVVAIGAFAMQTGGHYNGGVAVGSRAMQLLIESGGPSVAVGRSALYGQRGGQTNGSTVVGGYAGYNFSSATSTTAVGYKTASANSGSYVSDYGSTFLGAYAGTYYKGGDRNLVIDAYGQARDSTTGRGGDSTQALIYGHAADSAHKQLLRLNAVVKSAAGIDSLRTEMRGNVLRPSSATVATASYTIDTAVHSSAITVTYAGAAVITLPSPVSGLTYTIINEQTSASNSVQISSPVGMYTTASDAAVASTGAMPCTTARIITAWSDGARWFLQW